MKRIYKIENKVNGKVYIGQTVKTSDQRFLEHIDNALSGKKYLLSRAIRKYGASSFSVETVLDNLTQEEANFYERYFIKKYQSNVRGNGYNMTEGGEGGDTFSSKTEDEMLDISKKISLGITGAKNGNAHSVNIKNIDTGRVYKFETISRCVEFLNEEGFLKDKNAVSWQLNCAKCFGIQPVFCEKYIVSESEVFSDYTLVHPKRGQRCYKVTRIEDGKQLTEFGLSNIAKAFNVSVKKLYNSSLFNLTELKRNF